MMLHRLFMILPCLGLGLGGEVDTPVRPAESATTFKVPEGQYADIKFDVPKGASAVVRFSPQPLQKAQGLPAGRLIFAGEPGKTYTVSVVLVDFEAKTVTDLELSVVFEKKTPPVVVPPPKGKTDPVNAIGKLRFRNSGCTATVVGPRRADGKWDVLTAAHCMNGVGDKGTVTMKDGRVVGVTVAVHAPSTSFKPGPDLAWLVTDSADLDLPYAELAPAVPPVGTALWHMGYGVDKPGNREEGVVSALPLADGKVQMKMSFSSGDSGGGIFDAEGRVVAVVCCTSSFAVRTTSWGGSCEAAAKLRPSPTGLTAPRIFEERECPPGIRCPTPELVPGLRW